MKKIKVYVSYNERNKIHGYREFDIIEKLPDVGSIKNWNWKNDGDKIIVEEIHEAHIDTCQGNDEVYNYNYYVIKNRWERLNDNDEWEFEDYEYEYVAIPKEDIID